ncbi:MAG: lysoplasmalogenase [Spirochaetia bacterium]|nr:lysoplasmalogenase [Spirochaetia bacterium]
MAFNPRSLISIAFASLITAEFVALFFGAEMISLSVYRVYHLAQMIFLIFAGWIVYRTVVKTRTRTHITETDHARIARFVLIGLVFSFIGDVINSKLIDLTSVTGIKQQVLLSIPVFAIAHILYIRSFLILSSFNVSKRTRIILLVLWPVLSVILWKSIVNPASALMVILSFPYAFMVTLMALTSLRVPLAWGSIGYPTAVGGFLFLLSDSLIGWVLGREGSFAISQVIWFTYFAAQILILRAVLIPVT